MHFVWFSALVDFFNYLVRESFCAVLSHSVLSDCATLWTVARQVPLSTGILQAKILEWVAMPFSRGIILNKGISRVFTSKGYGEN